MCVVVDPVPPSLAVDTGTTRLSLANANILRDAIGKLTALTSSASSMKQYNKVVVTKVIGELSSILPGSQETNATSPAMITPLSSKVIQKQFDFVRTSHADDRDAEVSNWIASHYMGTHQVDFCDVVQNLLRLRRSAAKSIKPIDPLAVEEQERLAHEIQGLSVRDEVEQRMDTLGDWDFDVFDLDEATNGKPLVVTMKYLHTRLAWNEKLRMPIRNLVHFFTQIENTYNSESPYHNAVHATDVVASVYYWSKSRVFQRHARPLDIMLMIVAAACHDVGHPGFTNSFLVSSESELAAVYNNKSVLENFHASTALTFLKQPENDILVGVSRQERGEALDSLISMILATDMSMHMEQYEKMTTLGAHLRERDNEMVTLDAGAPMDTTGDGSSTVPSRSQSLSQSQSASSPDAPVPLSNAERQTLLDAALHTADVANPAKQNKMALEWAHRFLEESYRQGDMETQIGLPMTPCYDRLQPLEKRCQLGFIEWVVEPQFKAWAELLPDVSQPCLDHVADNKLYWQQQPDPGHPIKISKKGRNSVLLAAKRMNPNVQLQAVGGRSSDAGVSEEAVLNLKRMTKRLSDNVLLLNRNKRKSPPSLPMSINKDLLAVTAAHHR